MIRRLECSFTLSRYLLSRISMTMWFLFSETEREKVEMRVATWSTLFHQFYIVSSEFTSTNSPQHYNFSMRKPRCGIFHLYLFHSILLPLTNLRISFSSLMLFLFQRVLLMLVILFILQLHSLDVLFSAILSVRIIWLWIDVLSKITRHQLKSCNAEKTMSRIHRVNNIELKRNVCRNQSVNESFALGQRTFSINIQ